MRPRAWSASACFCSSRWLVRSSSCALRASCSPARAASASAAEASRISRSIVTSRVKLPAVERWARTRLVSMQ